METMGALSPAEVDQWVDSAEPGESKVYAWGDQFPRSAPGVVATRAAVDDGVITCTTRKRVSDGRREYVMLRLAKRQRERAASASKGAERQDSPEAIIMRELRRAAASKRPCPSNNDLARKATLPDGYAASYIVGKLKKARKIRVEFVGPRQRRQITIVSSGAQTAAAEA